MTHYYCDNCEVEVDPKVDAFRGERACPRCGELLSENELEQGHAGYLAEGSQWSTRNCHRADGQNDFGGTGPAKWEAFRFGRAGAQLHYTQRNEISRHTKKYVRATKIHEVVKSKLQLGRYVVDTVAHVINAGWVEQPDETDGGMKEKLGPLPRNSFRFMQGEPQDYQLAVGALAAVMAASDETDIGPIEWKAIAEELELPRNHLLKAKKIIKKRISKLKALGRWDLSKRSHWVDSDINNHAFDRRAEAIDRDLTRLADWLRVEAPNIAEEVMCHTIIKLSELGEPCSLSKVTAIPSSMLVTALAREQVKNRIYGKCGRLSKAMGHSDGCIAIRSQQIKTILIKEDPPPSRAQD